MNLGFCGGLLARQRNASFCRSFERRFNATRRQVDRLGLEWELKGHTSCVNCLEWNRDGSLLASGSDDQTAIIWDAVAHRTKLIHRTGHSGNIFSVKFLPHSNDDLLVTAAADGEIRLHDLSRGEVIEEFRCNEKRVKRISTTPDMPYMFWSAAEDGTVRQYDLRQSSSDRDRILINLRSACGSQAEVKCLSINPTQPHLLAIGCSDQYVRLFDIRKLVIRSESQMNHPYPDDAPVHYFCPGHLNEQISHKRMRRYRQFAVTYVTWSLDGRELLVNLGSEQVYLYDLCDTRRPVHFSSMSTDDKFDDAPSESSTAKAMSDHALQLKIDGNAAFKEQQYSKAIYLYSEAMVHSPKQPVLHANRAAAYLKRQWYGDVYAALKDCYTALSFDPSNHKAHLRQANCLHQLKWHKLARECILQFQQRFPTRAAKSQELAKAIEEDVSKSSKSKDSTNGSDAEHGNSTEIEFQRTAVDFKYHYCGHCNTTTDIKEASFFGGQSQYIAAGSDDGHCFIWEKDTTRLAQVINGDDSIVNCVQPHPSQLLLATSGIDPVIRLWSPHSQNYDRTVGCMSATPQTDKSQVATIEKIAADNQKRMRSDPLEIMLMNMGMRFGPVGGGDSGDEEEAAVHCRPS